MRCKRAQIISNLSYWKLFEDESTWEREIDLINATNKSMEIKNIKAVLQNSSNYFKFEGGYYWTVFLDDESLLLESERSDQCDKQL